MQIIVGINILFILISSGYATYCLFKMRRHVDPEKLKNYTGDYKGRIGQIPPTELLDDIGLEEYSRFRISGALMLAGVAIQYFFVTK